MQNILKFLKHNVKSKMFQIGSLSTQMMKAKDSRVQIMSEILSGIRVIKYFGWEPYFAQKVFKSREEELKHLKGRKYLDAVCVYLWATTPVLISGMQFVFTNFYF